MQDLKEQIEQMRQRTLAKHRAGLDRYGSAWIEKVYDKTWNMAWNRGFIFGCLVGAVVAAIVIWIK